MRDVPPNTTNVIQMTVLHINRVLKSSGYRLVWHAARMGKDKFTVRNYSKKT